MINFGLCVDNSKLDSERLEYKIRLVNNSLWCVTCVLLVN